MDKHDEIRMLLKAVSFAARAHRHQLRKDKETPYASHVFRVCLILRDVFGISDRRLMTAAVLHDTIEDTTVDFDEIAEEFDGEIACWVSLLSKDKRLVDEKREADYCERLRTAPWQVKACKLADMYDNLMDMQNLPAERRPRVIHRVETYLAALEPKAGESLQGPLTSVRSLLKEVRGAGN